MPYWQINTSAKRRLIDFTVFASFLQRHCLVFYHYYNEVDKESPRRSSRLTKNAEHIVFQLPRGKIFFRTEVVVLTGPTSKVHVYTGK